MEVQLSAEEISEHIAVLNKVEADYDEYLQAWIFEQPQRTEFRNRLLRQASRAQRAIDASGYTFTMVPAKMFGGPILTSLPSQLFAFERPAYAGPTGGDQVPHGARLLLDAFAAAEGRLEDKLEEARRAPKRKRRADAPAHRRRSPVFGRIRALPAAVAFVADFGAAVTVMVAAAKVVGIW